MKLERAPAKGSPTVQDSMTAGKGEMRSHLSSGIREAVFGTPIPAPNAISPGQNPTPPGIWGQIPPVLWLGSNPYLILTLYFYFY